MYLSLMTSEEMSFEINTGRQMPTYTISSVELKMLLFLLQPKDAVCEI